MHAVERRLQAVRDGAVHRDRQATCAAGPATIVELEEVAGVALGEIVEEDQDLVHRRRSADRSNSRFASRLRL